MKEKIGGSYQSISFPGSSDGKESSYNAGDLGLIPRLGGSPGERKGNPLQCSCLENPMDKADWWATVHGVTKSWNTTELLILSLSISINDQVTQLMKSK